MMDGDKGVKSVLFINEYINSSKSQYEFSTLHIKKVKTQIYESLHKSLPEQDQGGKDTSAERLRT